MTTPADHSFYHDPNTCACGERKECDHSCMPDVIDGFCSYCGKPSVGSQFEGVASVNSDAREAGNTPSWPQEAIDQIMIEHTRDEWDWRGVLLAAVSSPSNPE